MVNSPRILQPGQRYCAKKKATIQATWGNGTLTEKKNRKFIYFIIFTEFACSRNQLNESCSTHIVFGEATTEILDSRTTNIVSSFELIFYSSERSHVQFTHYVMLL